MDMVALRVSQDKSEDTHGPMVDLPGFSVSFSLCVVTFFALHVHDFWKKGSVLHE